MTPTEPEPEAPPEDFLALDGEEVKRGERDLAQDADPAEGSVS